MFLKYDHMAGSHTSLHIISFFYLLRQGACLELSTWLFSSLSLWIAELMALPWRRPKIQLFHHGTCRMAPQEPHPSWNWQLPLWGQCLLSIE